MIQPRPIITIFQLRQQLRIRQEELIYFRSRPTSEPPPGRHSWVPRWHQLSLPIPTASHRPREPFESYRAIRRAS